MKLQLEGKKKSPISPKLLIDNRYFFFLFHAQYLWLSSAVEG